MDTTNDYDPDLAAQSESNREELRFILKKHRTSLTNPQPLIAPATQNEPTFQGKVPAERYEIQGRYRTGAHSLIYRAIDRETGRMVGIKKHLHYIPETDNPEEIRSAEDRFGREAQVLAKLQHPGIMQAYGFFFKPEDGVSTPHLVMELIEQDSLEDRLERRQTFNEQDARALVLSVGSVLDYMHKVNSRPILYRDLKPDNIKVMPADAAWPHKIVDFSESRIGRSTMSGSVTGTIGYNAPEIIGGRIADQSTDFYSLMRVAAHMLIGDTQKFMASWLDDGASFREMKEEGDLNVSDKMLQAIERATAKDPEKRYKTLAELARDLGYEISQAPRTREELEAVLEHRSLLAKQETEMQEQTQTQLEPQNKKTIAKRAKAIYDPNAENKFNLLIRYDREVGGDQGGVLAVNIAREVGRDQGGVLAGLNIAREVGGDQWAGLGVNVAREVGRDQIGGLAGLNIAREVGGDQGGVLAGLNIAREVGGDQVGFLAVNIAKKIGIQKEGDLEKRISTQFGIINYAGEGNVDQVGILNIRGSGPWYSRISPIYGKLRTGGRKVK